MSKSTKTELIEYVANYIQRIGDMADYPERNFMPNEYICYYSEQVERLCQTMTTEQK